MTQQWTARRTSLHSKLLARMLLAAIPLAFSTPAVADASCETRFTELDSMAPEAGLLVPPQTRVGVGLNRVRISDNAIIESTGTVGVQRGAPIGFEISSPVLLRGKFKKFDRKTQNVTIRIYSSSRAQVDLDDSGMHISKTVDPMCREGNFYIPVFYSIPGSQRNEVYIVSG